MEILLSITQIRLSMEPNDIAMRQKLYAMLAPLKNSDAQQVNNMHAYINTESIYVGVLIVAGKQVFIHVYMHVGSAVLRGKCDKCH